jgi:Metallo-beta-lactamase superfamily
MAKSSPKRKQGSVRVRMYRQGLGDCFLLTFHSGSKERHVLIDCGTLGATTTGVKLEQVVEDIRKTTKNHLDLLVVTHEHSDHVVGFLRQRDAFKAMTIDRVWVAWTEDPTDDDAKGLAAIKKDLELALRAAAAKLQSPGVTDARARDAGLAIGSLLGFAESVDEAMKVATRELGVQPDFKNPGDGPLEEKWLPGFRTYVLGPPRKREALLDMGDHGSSELYGAALGLKGAPPLKELVRAAAAGDEDDQDPERVMPFDWRFRIGLDEDFVQQAYAGSYLAKGEEWRKIDQDWLLGASDLALQFDKYINNTSLVLAFERIADGRVLFFVADAQQGNWLSWEPLEWTVKDGSASKTVKAADLMKRAVFYKVGHHSSHNATAKGKGLELMESDELVAFIPVDRQVALKRHPQGSWKMPARSLYRRLLERTNGRVVRSDLGWAADAVNAALPDGEKEFEGLATKTEWAKWTAQQKKAAVTIGPLFCDYVLV